MASGASYAQRYYRELADQSRQKDDGIRRIYLELAVAYDRLAEVHRLMGFLRHDMRKRTSFLLDVTLAVRSLRGMRDEG
jgi:hypothetical protein